MEQFERVYLLTVGDYRTGKGVLIKDVHMRFDISKSADNKKKSNSATVELYNLSASTRAMLDTDYLSVKLEVGYTAAGTRVVLEGNVVERRTAQQGPDMVTQLILGEGYTDLNHIRLKQTIPPGQTAKDVIEAAMGQLPGVVRGVFSGTNINNPVVFGYPMDGSAKEILNDICRDNNMEWRCDAGALYVNDVNGIHDKNIKSAPVLNESTGLIGIPYRTSSEGNRQKGDKRRTQGVQFKALLNADFAPGQVVRIESKEVTGWYRINSARYYGGYDDQEWYVDCFCGIIIEEDLR
ncbi:hypothetical protein [Pseudomonas phage PH826]|uniref:Tail protein n=12 Tax=Nankokuvirus TaxID=1925779 RepID=A0A218L3X0_9CAUD|nr:hypothetical protein [Pseudomonas aeruginosa]YP_004306769.1 baseplate hub [Pseudomonas phage KPP10]YP_008856896.1 baseplate hub [Pseudomonas phage PAK_P5]YP_008857655.1 baseplate hub [Pseudomonas phage PAK_P3]YP_008858043.1 baseplate hub [Pseudomonas phage CHA_P1]YP_009206034.1 baseplate hub [Pseudomonas phage vB_PaeM_PS24]YP_009604697.1 baseplate hub [Pseudomonas phage vB_PaeM_G1]ADX32020.1 hypothetical protein P3_CHA0020 [Pseudomonas phage P3_CHA]QEM40946.1 hypothetical protein PAPJP_0